jgi:protease-4
MRLPIVLLSSLLSLPLALPASEGTVAVDLAGSLDLRPQAMLLQGSQTSRHQATADLRKAMRAPETTVFLDLTEFSGNLATAEELATTLRAERTAAPGKRVIALIDGATNATLILAAAADEVVMPEAGLLSVGGLNLESYYFADALAKIGVRFHAVSSGEHKTAHEPFTRNGPSPAGEAEFRELATALDAELAVLSVRPQLPLQALAGVRAKSPQTSTMARELHLVDAVAEPGAWRAGLPQPVRWEGDTSRNETPTDLAGMMRWIQTVLHGSAPERHSKAVAVVELAGEIIDGRDGQPGETITSEDTADLIDELAEDKRIVAVVLRIDSPGGSASASDRIHYAVRRLAARKPVVALFDQVAASGGYYIGCAADEILVHRTTITGSIGVFALIPDVSATLDLMGIHRFAVSTGPRADLDSLTAPFTPERQAALEQVVRDVDGRFQGIVATRRKLTPERVQALAGGRIFTGPQAVNNGLADGFGTLGSAVAAARRRANEEAPLPVERFPIEHGLLQRFAGLGGVHALASGLLPARLAARMRALANRRSVSIEAWANVPE